MNKFFLFRLILKNLLARKMRTILTFMGIAISIAFITSLISFGLALQKVSNTQITNIQALQIVDVVPGSANLVPLTDEQVKRIEGLGHVEMIAPYFKVASKIEYGHSSIDGIAFGETSDISKVEDLKIQYGSDRVSEKGMLITTSALKQLGASVSKAVINQNVTLTLVPKKNVLSQDAIAKENTTFVTTLPITGVIADDASAYVYIDSDIMKENGMEKYDGVRVKLSSKEYVSSMKKQVESMGFKSTSLKDTVDQVNQFFVYFQYILIALGAVAVIISSIGMFNTLTINLLEKTREIGFMKVLGTTNKDVYRIFLGESLIIGILGGVSGVVLTLLFGGFVNALIYNLAQASHNKAFELFYTPPWLIVLVVVITSLLSLMTGWWPSRRAARISPLDAIRYE